MYNRYLNPMNQNPPPEPPQELHKQACPPPEPPPSSNAKASGGLLSGFGESLSTRLQGLRFDMDTIVILLAIYFLVADSDDLDSDLLVLIGILFILGF